MRNLFFIACAFLCFSASAQIAPSLSDEKIERRRNEMNRYQQKYNQTEALVYNGDNYDVKYYRMDLRLNPDTSIGKYVKGTITTYFVTTIANVSTIKFDFASTLICVSVKYHGSNLSASAYTKVGNTLEITLPNIPSSGTLDSVAVEYRGVPPTVPYFGNGTGFVRAQYSSGNYFIYTLSEPYSAYTWWPCKSMVTSDKADSMDIIISTPSAHRVAANGTRVSETVSGGNRITYWKHRYPISTYQVALGVGRYTQYPATPTMVDINGTSMPYYNLILGTVSSTMQTVLDRTPLMITTLSGLYGDYPFKNEKYGHYTFGFGGGMEHNTFSGMNSSTYNSNSDWSVIAHELGHQWFGAAVTCGSWSDIWVNESFATYSEILVAEFAPSTTPGSSGQIAKTATKNLVMQSGNQAKSIYASDTSDMNAIFTPAVYIYERGAMVLNMLRTLLGDDKFFQALKNYQTDPLLQHNVAYTDDVKRHMEYELGANLDNFFDDWIYNTGVARYNGATWNYMNGRVAMVLPQTTEYSGISQFAMPLKIRLSRTNPTRDTVITLYDDHGIISSVDNGVLSSWGSNMINFRLSFEPTTITFDPFNDVLATGTFSKDAGLMILANSPVELNGVKQNNNSKLNWNIISGTDYASMDLERSTDNQHFSRIHSLSSANHVNETVFNFTDYNTTDPVNYYRVKLNLNDGSVLYSDIVALRSVVGETYFSISPNPAKDVVKITTAGKAEKLNISLISVEGKRVKTLKLQEIADFNNISIPVKDLKAGQYFVEIERISTGQKITKKIILLP